MTFSNTKITIKVLRGEDAQIGLTAPQKDPNSASELRLKKLVSIGEAEIDS